jgi:hypothetical protein
MAQPPPHSWFLDCAWCGFRIWVNARGMRGRDPGAGVEAANLMEDHVTHVHEKSWPEFLEATSGA